MYVWDVLLRCEVFCGSQQHGDLHTLPPCTRLGEGGQVWRGRTRWKEGMKEGGLGHPCLFYFNLGEKRYSVFLFGPTRRNTGCPLFHSLVLFSVFFLSFLPLLFHSLVCPSQIAERESWLWPPALLRLWWRRNYRANMRIFSPPFE